MPKKNENKNNNPLFIKLIAVLVVALIIASFFIGRLYSKVQILQVKTQQIPTNNQQPTANTKTQPKTQTQPAKNAKGVVSVDDDPVLGNKKAPVTIIEFSDYECPFCKRHFDQTLPQLIKDYIDTGKVKLVYRDFPLSFHDPMATKEAIAANCAREQGGDSKYFEYHDQAFTKTSSNGNGLNDEDLKKIATDIGLNLNSFNTCINDPAQKDEVKKDIVDGTASGVSGTPTFFIGKSTSNGKIDGEMVVGAQPYATFKAIIDPLLK